MEPEQPPRSGATHASATATKRSRAGRRDGDGEFIDRFRFRGPSTAPSSCPKVIAPTTCPVHAPRPLGLKRVVALASRPSCLLALVSFGLVPFGSCPGIPCVRGRKWAPARFSAAYLATTP